MKKALFLCLTVIFVLLSSITTFAEENALYADTIDEIINQTSDEAKKLLEKIGLSEYTYDEISNIGIDDIWEMISGIFKENLSQPMKMLLFLSGIIIVFAVCSCYISNISIQTLFESITVVIISLIFFSKLRFCISNASTSLMSVCTLMKTLVPIITAIASVSGNPTLAVSYNAITVYASEIIGALCSDFLTHVLLIFSVLSVSLTFNPVIQSENILSVIKKSINTILGFCASVFTGISGIKNLLSSGADKISVKGIQFLLGSSVPVVGGALSDGLSSIIATVDLIKSTAGVIVVIIIIILVLPVICELILWSCVLSLSSYLCGIFSQTQTESVINALKFVITMLMSIILFCAYIFIVSTGMVILMGSN